MRILIIGGRGLLGSRLTAYLHAVGHDVTAYSRSDRGADLPILCDIESANQLIAATAPCAVINLAAITDVDYCEVHVYEAFSVNTCLPDWIGRAAEAARRQPIVVHLSTDQVYDGQGPHPETFIAPRNVYSQTKLAGENAILARNGTVLRTNFFGKSLTERRTSFSDWVYSSLSAGKSITAFSDVHFSPLGMGSLCKAIELSLAAPTPGVFNLGSSNGLSKADFIRAFAGELGLDQSLICDGSLENSTLIAQRPKDMRLDSRKFSQQFKFEIPSIQQELQNECANYRA